MLSSWDKRLLSKHKSRYLKLAAGQVQPTSQQEEHFVKTFDDGLKPVTQHEIAYNNYLISVANGKIETLSDTENNPQNDLVEKFVDEIDKQIISSKSDKKINSLLSGYRDEVKNEKFNKKEFSTNAALWLNYLTESHLSKSLEQLSASSFNTLSNAYTKALDGTFVDGLKSGSDYVSPTLHRLIERGHTLPEAFKKGRDALDNDTNIQELYGTLSALLSDMSSVVGLPLLNVSKNSINSVKDVLKEFGIDEKRLADFLSYNSIEVFSSIIPAIAILFSWNKADTKKFTELASSLGLTTAYAGNPIGLVISLVGLAKSFHKAKNENVSTFGWIKSIGTGGIKSTVVLASMSVLGGTVWLTMISAIVIAYILMASGIKIDWNKVTKAVLKRLK